MNIQKNKRKYNITYKIRKLGVKVESRAKRIIHNENVELATSSKKWMNELTGKFHYVIQLEI